MYKSAIYTVCISGSPPDFTWTQKQQQKILKSDINHRFNSKTRPCHVTCSCRYMSNLAGQVTEFLQTLFNLGK